MPTLRGPWIQLSDLCHPFPLRAAKPPSPPPLLSMTAHTNCARRPPASPSRTGHLTPKPWDLHSTELVSLSLTSFLINLRQRRAQAQQQGAYASHCRLKRGFDARSRSRPRCNYLICLCAPAVRVLDRRLFAIPCRPLTLRASTHSQLVLRRSAPTTPAATACHAADAGYGQKQANVATACAESTSLVLQSRWMPPMLEPNVRGWQAPAVASASRLILSPGSVHRQRS